MGTPQIDPKNPLIEGFALLDLTKLMSSSRSKQIVGIIDACHSGAASIKFKPKAAKEETNRALAVYYRIGKQIPKTKGISLLLSSQDYQSSFAPANTNNDNSFYTKYILEAIGGVKPGVDENGRYIRYSGSVDEFGDVTPHSIHEYVYFRVASKMEEQIPRFTSSTSGNIVILHYPELGLHTFEDQERVIRKQVILVYSELVQSMISVIHIKGELKEIVDEGIPEGIENRRRKIRRARYDAKRASPLISFMKGKLRGMYRIMEGLKNQIAHIHQIDELKELILDLDSRIQNTDNLASICLANSLSVKSKLIYVNKLFHELDALWFRIQIVQNDMIGRL